MEFSDTFFHTYYPNVKYIKLKKMKPRKNL